MRTLHERSWIRVVGHREVPGRPELLGTTREFLDYFGLKSLDDLPTLAELQDLEDINEQLDLPGAPTVVEPVALPPPTAQSEEAAAELDDMPDDEAAADDEDEDRPQLDAPTLVASPPGDTSADRTSWTSDCTSYWPSTASARVARSSRGSLKVACW